MNQALFDPDVRRGLPLWAQVLTASRLARRAVLALPEDIPEDYRTSQLVGLDAIDRCCEAGARLKSEIPIIDRARDRRPARAAEAVSVALKFAADAAHAANDSLDFSAAESACESSVARSLEAAGAAVGLNPLQAGIYAAADVDLLEFNCRTFKIGRYDGLGPEVMLRLHPVHPPADRLAHSPGPMDDDPTGGAR